MKLIIILFIFLNSCALYRVEIKTVENYNHHEQNFYNKDLKFPLKVKSIVPYYNSINHKPILIDSIMLYMTSNGKLTVLNLDKNKTRDPYKFLNGTDIAPILSRNSLIITIENGRRNLLRYDLEEREFLWEINFEYGADTKPIVTEDAVYIASLNGILHKVDFYTGEIIWTKKLDKYNHSNPTHFKDKIFIADDSGKLYAISKVSGEILWEKQVTKYPVYSPLILVNNMVIMADINKSVFAYQADLGEQIWNTNAESPIYGEFAFDNSFLYVGTTGGAILKLNPVDGTIALKIQKDQVFNSQPLIGANNIYIGGGNGDFFIFDKNTGKELFTQQFKGQFISSPIFWKDNLIVFSDYDDIHLISENVEPQE